MSLPSDLAPFAGDVAFVSEDKPARSLAEFIVQLKTAVGYFHFATHAIGPYGNGYRTAIQALMQAEGAKGAVRDALVRRAAGHLAGFAATAAKYRAM